MDYPTLPIGFQTGHPDRMVQVFLVFGLFSSPRDTSPSIPPLLGFLEAAVPAVPRGLERSGAVRAGTEGLRSTGGDGTEGATATDQFVCDAALRCVRESLLLKNAPHHLRAGLCMQLCVCDLWLLL